MDPDDLEKYLAPISDDEPCGPDLEYDPDFGEMERAAQPKSEQQFGDTIVAAEPPDWKDVQKRAKALMERTRDMRVVVMLARATLAQQGLNGFRLCMELLRGYVEQYWDNVYPELDHEDDDDPTYRTNTLITLCDEDTMLRELREAPIVSSRALGRFNLKDVEAASEAQEHPPADDSGGGGAWAEDEPAQEEPKPSAPSMAAIEGAFTEVEIEVIQGTEEDTRLAAEHLAAIEQFVTEQVGVSNAVSLLPARNILEEMNKFICSQLERRGVYAEEEEIESGEVDESGEPVEGGSAPVASSAAAASFQVNGKIGSRKDAIKALDAVCEFYEENEPSSPLPLLIRRAQRLASKSFLEIIRDLAPDAVSQAEALGGGGSASGETYSESSEESGEDSSSW